MTEWTSATWKSEMAMDFKNMSVKKKILLLLSALVILAAIVIVIVFLTGDKDVTEEPPEEIVKELPIVAAPDFYRLETLDSVLALPVGRSDEIVVREEIPEIPEEEPEEEPSEKPSPEPSGEQGEDPTEPPAEEEKPEKVDPLTVAVTYHYEGLATPASRAALYCSLLAAEDFGFTPVDAEMMAAELPSFEEPAGSVHLVRPITEDESGAEVKNTMFSLQISWDEERCLVTVGRYAGRIRQPAPENNYRPPLTLTTAVDYFYSCHPSKLGLEGETMAVYDVLPLDGAVLIGTTPCLRINVYAVDERTGTNVLAGQYLLSDNGMTLYRIGPEGEIIKLDA